MPTSLLASQFQTLEAPAGAIVLDIDRPVDALVHAAAQALAGISGSAPESQPQS
jgi:gluconate kinase